MSGEKPVIVYLDTQDFIRTFNKPIDNPDAIVLNKLLEMKAEGKVAFGYSAITLIEFITKPTEEYKQERRQRGTHVKTICGNNAFPYSDKYKSGARFPNAGFWLSDVSKSALNFKKIIREAEQDCFKSLVEKEQLNRSLRRKLSKPGALIAFAKKNGTNFSATPINFGDFPVTQEFRDGNYMNKVLSGRISIQKAEFEFTRWLNDPEAFSALVFECGKSEAIIEKYFGTSIRQLSEAAEKLTTFQHEIKELNLKIESANKVSKELELDAPRLKKIKLPTLDEKQISGKIQESLGAKYSEHFQVYYNSILKHPDQFKSSDLMDIMQMVHAYEADLFRCDKHMADRYKNFEPFKTKLVKSFNDLPKRIEEIWNKGC